MTNTTTNMVISSISNEDESKSAYVVRTKKQLSRLNQLLGLTEICYPALYISMAGMFHPVPLTRKDEYVAIGYRIVKI